MDTLAIPDHPTPALIAFLTKRVAALEDRQYAQELELAALRDEMQTTEQRLLRQFHHHRHLLERLVVRHLGLPSAEVLVLPRSLEGRGWSRMPRDGNFSAAEVGRIILYYVLLTHDVKASYSLLRRSYHWFPRSNPTLLDYVHRAELIALNRNRRRLIEREFLDATGRTDEPVSEVDLFAKHNVARYKQYCLHSEQPYRFSAVPPRP